MAIYRRNTSLLRRDDARRLAATVVKNRQLVDGEKFPLPSTGTRGLQRMAANVVAQLASTPASERTVKVARITNDLVVLRLTCDGGRS